MRITATPRACSPGVPAADRGIGVVMAGLAPAIHVFLACGDARKALLAGSSQP